MRRLLIVGTVSAALAVPALATGSLSSNTVKPKAKLGGDGERAMVTVLLACDEAQAAKLKVTATQGSANGQERALARGGEKVECGTAKAGFPVRVTVRKAPRSRQGDRLRARAHRRRCPPVVRRREARRLTRPGRNPLPCQDLGAVALGE